VTADDLRAALQETLESYAFDGRGHQRGMLSRFLEESLDLLASREALYRDAFGMTPAHFELAFGLEQNSREDNQREYDPASTESPLILDSGDGASVQLCGAIDRVDLSTDGRMAMVMDYKSGNSVEYSAIQSGESLQMPIYLMALEQLWSKAAGVACYDSPRDKGRRRFFRTDLADMKRFGLIQGVDSGREVKPVSQTEHDETMVAAREAVFRAAAGIASADILPRPGAH